MQKLPRKNVMIYTWALGSLGTLGMLPGEIEGSDNFPFDFEPNEHPIQWYESLEWYEMVS